MQKEPAFHVAMHLVRADGSRTLARFIITGFSARRHRTNCYYEEVIEKDVMTSLLSIATEMHYV